MLQMVKQLATMDATVKNYSSINKDGDKTYGAATAIKCYVAKENQIIETPSGERVTSKTQFYIDALTYTVSDDNIITFESVEYNSKAVSTFYRSNVKDLYVVYA